MKGKTRIKLQGHLDKLWEDRFEGMDIILTYTIQPSFNHLSQMDHNS